MFLVIISVGGRTCKQSPVHFLAQPQQQRSSWVHGLRGWSKSWRKVSVNTLI